MALADRILQLKLVADVDQVSKELRKVETATTRMGARFSSGFSRMGGAVKSFGLGLAASAPGMITDWLAGGVEMAVEAEQVFLRLRRAVRTVSRNMKRDLGGINRFAEKALDFGFDPDEVKRSTAVIIEQTGFKVPQALKLMTSAIDLAANQNISLEESTDILLAALRGEEEGLQALNLMHLKNISLARLTRIVQRRMGNAAEETAETVGGKARIVTQRLGKLQQRFGTTINDTLGRVIELADEFGPSIRTNMGTAQTVVDIGLLGVKQKVVEAEVGIVTAAAGIGQGIYDKIKGTSGDVSSGIVGAAAAVIRGTQTIIDTLTVRQEPIAAAAAGVGDAIHDPITERVIDTERRVDRMTQTIITAQQELQGLAQAMSGIPLFPRFLPWQLNGMASGGIVRRPTLALIGERGPEAVVPLNRGGGMGITVNVYTGVGDPVQIGREVDRVLRAYRGRSGVAA